LASQHLWKNAIAPEVAATPPFRTSESGKQRTRFGQFLTDRFRCPPENVATFSVKGELSQASGYFRFGPDITCYGRCSSGDAAELVTGPLHDAREHVIVDGSSVQLPFDPAQVVDSLRCERYIPESAQGKASLPASSAIRNAYYLVRPLLPVSVRKHVQRLYFRTREAIPFPAWPVDRTVEDLYEQLLILSMKCQGVERIPFIWFWPEGAPSCTIVTHDVETAAGVDFCPRLMDLADSFGIKTAFEIVPEKRYPVPDSLLEGIRKRGFEVNLHDLNHDGHLFSDRDRFMRRAKRINAYARQFGTQGFRSAVMYRNVDWYDALDVSFDMSIPNVAHLDPQQGGCCTVFPFFVGKILELPVTTVQDYSLFHILSDYSIRLWKEQISLIREKHGLISTIIHPDYIIDDAARKVCAEFLGHLAELRSQGQTWIALPSEVAAWWRLRCEMTLVSAGDSWRIQGEGSERARLAYAVLENDKLQYTIDPVSKTQKQNA
jgi:hypothetical protein